MTIKQKEKLNKQTIKIVNRNILNDSEIIS